MYHEKCQTGRGPSMMGGSMSLFMALFGVFWTVTAVSIGAGPSFALFGVFFIGAALQEDLAFCPKCGRELPK